LNLAQGLRGAKALVPASLQRNMLKSVAMI
jgi:hypothetical protein